MKESRQKGEAGEIEIVREARAYLVSFAPRGGSGPSRRSLIVRFHSHELLTNFLSRPEIGIDAARLNRLMGDLKLLGTASIAVSLRPADRRLLGLEAYRVVGLLSPTITLVPAADHPRSSLDELVKTRAGPCIHAAV